MYKAFKSPILQYSNIPTLHPFCLGAPWSSGAMARTGFRMMPTSPSPPLKFRTAGFPRDGFKASMSDRAFLQDCNLKLAPGIRLPPRSLLLPFARFHHKGNPGSVSKTIVVSARCCSGEFPPYPRLRRDEIIWTSPRLLRYLVTPASSVLRHRMTLGVKLDGRTGNLPSLGLSPNKSRQLMRLHNNSGKRSYFARVVEQFLCHAWFSWKATSKIGAEARQA